MSFLGKCLGKLPVVLDARTLRLSSYLLRDVPAPAPMRDWAEQLPVDLGLYRNDTLGVCGVASTAHLMKVWSSQHGAVFAATEYDVIKAYSAIGGYVPSDPTSDRGTDMLAVCKYWRNTGIAGRKIRAFVKLDHDSPLQLKVALNLFGGVYAGASLPRAAANTMQTWGAPPGVLLGDLAVGSWGGHAMAVLGYDRAGVTFATWGRRQKATWAWWLTYIDEAYALLDDSWVNADVVAPNGFDFAQLAGDIADLEAA